MARYLPLGEELAEAIGVPLAVLKYHAKAGNLPATHPNETFDPTKIKFDFFERTGLDLDFQQRADAPAPARTYSRDEYAKVFCFCDTQLDGVIRKNKLSADVALTAKEWRKEIHAATGKIVSINVPGSSEILQREKAAQMITDRRAENDRIERIALAAREQRATADQAARTSRWHP